MNIKLALIVWAVMVLIAIVNGLFGQYVVSKILGDYGAHLYRTFFAVAVIFISARLYLNLTTGAESWFMPAFSVGILWLASSMTFEFGVGHFVFRIPWEKFRDEYNIFEGRLWSLVLASEVLAPLIHAWLLRR